LTRGRPALSENEPVLRRLPGQLQHTWVQLLVVGLILFAVLDWATVQTKNLNLVPSLICLGAFLGPVVFVAYVYERAREVPLPLLLWCFLVGGVLGVVAASVLEYRTLIDLHALPTIAVGLAEETSKLVLPLAIFLLAPRYWREADGLLFGVAAGMGFAACETMGYGLTALLHSHGQISEVERVLFVRNVLSPANHAAWTGLLCAALWRGRLRPGLRSTLAVAGTFLLVVLLHALWDSATTGLEQLPVALVSFALLSRRLDAATRSDDALAARTDHSPFEKNALVPSARS
jgi:RsiW-degrading membrane proteinase PrsW (M82 family)